MNVDHGETEFNIHPSALDKRAVHEVAVDILYVMS